MYAVIKDRGKQYTVKAGDRLRIDLMDAVEGSEIVFDQVLLVGADGGGADGGIRGMQCGVQPSLSPGVTSGVERRQVRLLLLLRQDPPGTSPH